MGGMPMQQMDWRQVAQMVARANPGAPPEVIAAAVSKAVPLMNQDSQMQWRMIQMQLAQERVNQGEERLRQQQSQFEQRQTETERSHRATEEGRTAGREERQHEFDTREGRLREALDLRKDTQAQNLVQKAEAARQKALGLQVSQDLKLRQQAVKEARDRYNDFDKHMRTKIQADSTLSGKEKKDALTQLDAAWARHERDLSAADQQAPATPSSRSQMFEQGKDALKQGQGYQLGGPQSAAPEARPPGKYTNPQTGETGTWDGKTWTPD